MKLTEMDNGEKRDSENAGEVVGSSKRSRFEMSFPFVVGSSCDDESPQNSDALRLSTSSSSEEVDLELRLGYQSEVK